jgi:hypothetical protein
MLAVTWMDIIDSAIKIGLGALIAGSASFAVARLGHAKELERERLRQSGELEKERLRQAGELQKDVLKQTVADVQAVAARIESFSSAFLDYAYHCPVTGDPDVVEDARLRQRILANRKLAAAEAERLCERQQAARRKNDELVVARTLLHLLGAGDASQALTAYKHACEQFWLASTAGEQFSTLVYADRMRDVIQARNALDQALTSLYPIKPAAAGNEGA